jgi:NADPH:quinone reductase-like Zn-dependent oxidoreductase
MAKDASILGMTLWNVAPAEASAIAAGIGAGLREGYLRPVTGRAFPLAQASAAHRAVLEPGAHGKVALLPR